MAAQGDGEGGLGGLVPGYIISFTGLQLGGTGVTHPSVVSKCIRMNADPTQSPVPSNCAAYPTVT